jgi:hypothetical protein
MSTKRNGAARRSTGGNSLYDFHRDHTRRTEESIDEDQFNFEETGMILGNNLYPSLPAGRNIFN